MTAPASATLPPLRGTRFVTDGGLETDLIFHHGVDLPDFAAFPLLDTAAGRGLLTGYYDDYAAIARRAGAGLLLETPTWRASPDWGRRLGYTDADLTRVNTDAVALLDALRERYAPDIDPILVSGSIGPRGDGYSAVERLSPLEAADYHRPQLRAFAAARADLATAYTLTHAGEAIGIVRAARIAGIRANASVRSHAELDAAEDLDEGDIGTLTTSQDALTRATRPHHPRRLLRNRQTTRRRPLERLTAGSRRS